MVLVLILAAIITPPPMWQVRLLLPFL
ncbi:hypothetical protein QIU19_07715 [Capnocytophaga canimorsus]|nr:hypothetical protein [Capnocytophaga canimorsus]WGU69507.1 hypothetical protein QIU19_07715 [Capnocytophaga canimorsus]